MNSANPLPLARARARPRCCGDVAAASTAPFYGAMLRVIASPHTPRASRTFSLSVAYVRFSGSRQGIASILPISRGRVNKPQVRRPPNLPAIKHGSSYLQAGYIAFSILLGKFMAALRVARSTHPLLFEKWTTSSFRLGSRSIGN